MALSRPFQEDCSRPLPVATPHELHPLFTSRCVLYLPRPDPLHIRVHHGVGKRTNQQVSRSSRCRKEDQPAGVEFITVSERGPTSRCRVHHGVGKRTNQQVSSSSRCRKEDQPAGAEFITVSERGPTSRCRVHHGVGVREPTQPVGIKTKN